MSPGCEVGRGPRSESEDVGRRNALESQEFVLRVKEMAGHDP